MDPLEKHKTEITNGVAAIPNGEAKEANGKINGKMNGKIGAPVKVHTHRNSLLTDLMELTHLQTVHNISVALCFLLLINTAIYYATTPQIFLRDMSILLWAMSGFWLAFATWVALNVYAYLVMQGFKQWAVLRYQHSQKVVDYLFLSIYSCSMLSTFVLTPYVMRINEVGLISSFALLCEQVRIIMKIYSFVYESVQRVLRYNPEKDGKLAAVSCPSTQHFIYYLFAPTLIYRDSYPRTKEIRWDYVTSIFFEFLACIFIEFCILMRYNIDIFSQTGLRPYSLTEGSLIIACAIFLGGIDMFLMFYAILHCSQNLAAELLRFGDRKFYEDWWNSTSFSQYYRKMNTIVYDWINTYVYTVAMKLGLKRSTAMISCFVASALFHEYIIIFTLGYFFPMLYLSYTTVGLFFLFITKEKTAVFWNTFMWGMLFSGWGCLIFQYSLEWYARVNCPQTVEAPWDYFVPRSWTSTCSFLKYS